jgi:hypothetical protein
LEVSEEEHIGTVVELLAPLDSVCTRFWCGCKAPRVYWAVYQNGPIAYTVLFSTRSAHVMPAPALLAGVP